MVHKCVGYAIAVNREKRCKCTGVGKTLNTILSQRQTHYCHSHCHSGTCLSHVSTIGVKKLVYGKKCVKLLRKINLLKGTTDEASVCTVQYVLTKSSSGLNDQWGLVKGLPLQVMISNEQKRKDLSYLKP